jgi:acetoin utilization deacetylase AcuC-like enzyme
VQTIYTERHKLRDAKTELYGGELVAPFECPIRAEYIISRVREVGLGEVIGPRNSGLEPVLRVHNADFVAFLETCRAEWQAAVF